MQGPEPIAALVVELREAVAPSPDNLLSLRSPLGGQLFDQYRRKAREGGAR